VGAAQDGSDNLSARAHSSAGGDFWLVAGVRFASEKNTRPLPWTREVPFKLGFERDLRPGQRPKHGHVRVVSGAGRPTVAGSKQGRLARTPR